MPARLVGSLILVTCLLWMFPSSSTAVGPSLPVEPDEGTRVDELFDSESRLYLSLYSLKGDGIVDYIAGRFVREHARNEYGNPIYYAERFPMFYWWNHILWVDRDQDGVNGNELVYQENVDFDRKRYKPCLFNGQLC
jgi:hypothetical protein